MAREPNNSGAVHEPLSGFDGSGGLVDMLLEISQREWFSDKARHAALRSLRDISRVIHNGQHDKKDLWIWFTHLSQEFQFWRI